MSTSSTRDPFSLGALTLILCLALPVGVLSLFAPSSTADEVDAAEVAALLRVAAIQQVADREVTIIQFELEHLIFGEELDPVFQLTFDGRPALEASDLVVAMLSLDPPTLHGAYPTRKHPRSGDYEVLEPMNGLLAMGVPDTAPVDLALVEDGIRMRRGLNARSRRGPQVAADEEEDDPEEGTTFDHGNTIGEATPVVLDPPHPVTGMPTAVTGMLTPGDIDFFSFEAPILALLHAETRLPAGVTGLPPDTIIGLFDATTEELLAFDDDSGAGPLSRMVVPLEFTGQYAVAVEGAPDPNLDFTGATGTQTGLYELILELERASYIGNFIDVIVGVSDDGTFIEDGVGYKQRDLPDALLQGVPGDGWGLSYEVHLPSGISTVYGGSGDFLVDPSFGADVSRSVFAIKAFGDNRAGAAESRTALAHTPGNPSGMRLNIDYQIELYQRVVNGTLDLEVAANERVHKIDFKRLVDVDLFGDGADAFYWSFDPMAAQQVYPADVTTALPDVQPPAANQGDALGDLQIVMDIDGGDVNGSTLARPVHIRYPMAFTQVTDFGTEVQAVQAAVQNLTASGVTTWVVAVDVDPDTGLHTAFGAGLGDQLP